MTDHIDTEPIGVEKLTPEHLQQQLQEQLRRRLLLGPTAAEITKAAEMMKLLQAPVAAAKRPCVSRGRMVHTNGPWSNGHEEQCAIVTNVLGEGVASGSIVNLHVFIDADQPMIATGVPWYPTREEALASLLPDRNPVGGPEVCWFPDRT